MKENCVGNIRCDLKLCYIEIIIGNKEVGCDIFLGNFCFNYKLIGLFKGFWKRWVYFVNINKDWSNKNRRCLINYIMEIDYE